MLASVLLATAAIFHGTPVEIPWFASLTQLGSPICGGSLIAPDRVLTAAHCVQGAAPGDFDVAIGGEDRPWRGAYFPANYRLIRSPVRPDDYSASASIDDIAVIVLTAPVTDVAPVPIAHPAPADREPTTTVGRGITGPSGDQPDAPRQAGQQVLPTADCRRLYHRLLHASRHLCTNDPTPTKAQACPGDSGSAVLVRRDGALQLAGVVTWGGETQGRACGEGPADVAERVLPHSALITGPVPKRFAPAPRTGPRVIRRGTLNRCAPGTWQPAARFSFRWFRRHGRHKAYLTGHGRTRRSARPIDCEVTARTAGGWSRAAS